MRLTHEEHVANAHDWIGASVEPLEPGENVDRVQLAEQLQYTIADADDVEAIAKLIEEIRLFTTCLICGTQCGSRERPGRYLYRSVDGRRDDVAPFCSTECAHIYLGRRPDIALSIPHCALCGEIIINAPWGRSLSDDNFYHEYCTGGNRDAYTGTVEMGQL